MNRVHYLILLLFVMTYFGETNIAQDKLLTFDDLYQFKQQVDKSLTKVIWHPDGRFYLQIPQNLSQNTSQAVKVNAITGNIEPLYDPMLMQQTLANAGINDKEAVKISTLANCTFNQQLTSVLFCYQNDLYHYSLNNSHLTRLTKSPDKQKLVPQFSPDSQSVSFVKDNNLCVVNIETQKEKELTHDGNENILNGVLDWIYEEEIYGRGVKQGYWWNPNSNQIAFLQLNESAVPNFFITNDLPQSQQLQSTKYPKAGDPNPTAKLGVVNVKDGQLKWIDLSEYKSIEFLITRVGWHPDNNKIVFEIQNRIQNWLDLNTADVITGKTTKLLREESKNWVEIVELPEWNRDGSFFWQSDRTSWRHLYHYDSSGKLIKQLTQGQWDIREFYGVSDDGYVYFSGTKDSFIAIHLYRLALSNQELVRLSKQEGTHSTKFNSQLTLYLDTWSTVTSPPEIQLCKSDGTFLKNISTSTLINLTEYKLGSVQFLQVPTQDGFPLEAMMIKPPQFDPKKKYPVIVNVYGGPTTQQVKNSWDNKSYLWRQMLAQHGYIVWVCDNRSATNKGVQSAYPVYKNLGELELRDIEDGIKFLKKQPFVIADRIGIFGWSYGGYLTAYALTHSKTFKIGISGAPVTDWRSYDSVYTERYMGLPQDNIDGYERSSIISAASKLSGKLLLIHGLTDDNVHLQNTTQFIDALQQADKKFELMLYPEMRHSPERLQQTKHLYATMLEFIEKYL